MVYVARFSTHLRASVHMPVGRRLAMYCTASGRVFLSLLPRNLAREILESAPRPRVTPDTVTNIDELMELVDRAREQGYADSYAEFYRGDYNIAVPVIDAHGQPVAAINISAPSARWTKERFINELVPHLLETGKQVSTGQPPSIEMEPFRRGYGTSTPPPD